MSSRTFVAHSPLGEQLEFRSMEGTEQISRLFQFRGLCCTNPGRSGSRLG
ncbi:hypothetical protein HNP33_003678 [Comamonas odontotermitis]|uniref:Uncharacterized protein n=1 Tax=Comamonas odontotermitis TaxID=379895 RepID=A0ABR6RKN0_9BURK|nr:hypothetical protein [Comamonas odontotermitis]